MNVQVTIRYDPSMLERADALIDYVARDTGADADRVKVLRTATALGMKELERRRSKEEGAGGATA